MGLFPPIFPERGWSLTKFRQVASLASNAWNTDTHKNKHASGITTKK